MSDYFIVRQQFCLACSSLELSPSASDPKGLCGHKRVFLPALRQLNKRYCLYACLLLQPQTSVAVTGAQQSKSEVLCRWMDENIIRRAERGFEMYSASLKHRNLQKVIIMIKLKHF